MARGCSGRIVLEVEPALKREIYLMLDRKGQTLKEWFLQAAEAELLDHSQLALDLRPIPVVGGAGATTLENEVSQRDS